MNVPGTAQVDLNTAEEIVDYAFKNRNLLSEALHSPIRDRDETTEAVVAHDGNRRLAKLGRHVLQTILCDEWYGQPSLYHGHLDILLKTLTQRNFLADLVEQKNIVSCIYVSRRQGSIAVPPTTLEQCLLAIIAAVWLDSQKNSERVRQVLGHLGFFNWSFLETS